jgi:hypothetical protein
VQTNYNLMSDGGRFAEVCWWMIRKKKGKTRKATNQKKKQGKKRRPISTPAPIKKILKGLEGSRDGDAIAQHIKKLEDKINSLHDKPASTETPHIPPHIVAFHQLSEAINDETKSASRSRFRELCGKAFYGHRSGIGKGKVPKDVAVCHIIARANGGADHPRNYVLASAEMNGIDVEKNDYFYASFVGKTRTEEAVEISNKLKHLHHLARVRTKGYTGPTAKKLVKQGERQATTGRREAKLFWHAEKEKTKRKEMEEQLRAMQSQSAKDNDQDSLSCGEDEEASLGESGPECRIDPDGDGEEWSKQEFEHFYGPNCQEWDDADPDSFVQGGEEDAVEADAAISSGDPRFIEYFNKSRCLHDPLFGCHLGGGARPNKGLLSKFQILKGGRFVNNKDHPDCRAGDKGYVSLEDAMKKALDPAIVGFTWNPKGRGRPRAWYHTRGTIGTQPVGHRSAHHWAFARISKVDWVVSTDGVITKDAAGGGW